MALTAAQLSIFWIVLIAYLAVLMIFGWYSKKKTKSVEDYLLAGRSIGPVLLGLSFGVTYFSSVLIIGGGGLSFVWGLGTVWIAAIDVLIGVVLVFVFFGRKTKILSDRCKALTVPQLVGYRYQNKNYQMFSGLVVTVFEMIYLVSIYLGLSKLLTLLVPPEFQEVGFVIGVVLCAVITMLYLTAGGAFGAILSDAVESLIMIIGVVLIFIFGLAKLGGFGGFMQGLALAETNAPFSTGDLTTFIGFGGMGILGYILVTSFGMWGMPQAISRFFTAKRKKTMKWGMVIACLWASVVAFFAWINGAIASAYWWTAADGGDATAIAAIGQIFKDVDMNIPLFLQSALPPALTAIFIAAVTAASMTTGEKVILVSASGFAQDFYQNLMEQKGKKIPDEKMLKITRLTTIFVVIGGLLLALTKIEFVLALCMFAWSAMASTILVPFVFGLFWKRGTSKAAWASGVAGLAVAILWWFIFRFSNPVVESWFHDIRAIVLTTEPFAISWGDYYATPGGKFIKTGFHEFIMSQIVAIAVFVIVTLVTKPKDKAFVDEIFEEFKLKKKIREVSV
jgi:SSS family transporter